MTAQLPIVQYWHSAERPDYVVELTQSFVERNPGRPHLLFDAQTADDFIAEHFTPRESAAFRACGPPAMQADYLRYCALLHFGGVWADAGFMCTRDMSGLLEGSQGGELFRSFVSRYVLMNGLLAFVAPQHPFLRLAVDLSTELIERRWPGKVNEITGPLVVSTLYGLHRAGSAGAFLSELKEKMPDLPSLSQYARMLCELVGDYERVAEACEGVRVSPAECRGKWVCSPNEKLPHRSRGRHWGDLTADVYAVDSRQQKQGR